MQTVTPLTFTIANRPTWATFNTNTGRLQGTPAPSNVLTYGNIVISVSDGKASAPLPAFSITVASANAAPVISGIAGRDGQRSARSTRSRRPPIDADGDTLTFSITNKPAWATFNASTGRLQGTPAAANVGTAANIVISVERRQSVGEARRVLDRGQPPMRIARRRSPARRRAR